MISGLEEETARANEDEQFLLSLKDASTAKNNPWLKSKLAEVRGKSGKSKKSPADVPAEAMEPLMPMNDDWGATGRIKKIIAGSVGVVLIRPLSDNWN